MIQRQMDVIRCYGHTAPTHLPQIKQKHRDTIISYIKRNQHDAVQNNTGRMYIDQTSDKQYTINLAATQIPQAR